MLSINSEDAKTTFITLAVISFLLVLFGLPIPIANLVVGTVNRDHSCLQTDSIGLNLSQWLQGSGISAILVLSSIITLMYFAICNPLFNSGVMLIVIIINSVFNFIYNILGLVILVRSSQTCVSDGTDLGIMAIITIVLYTIVIYCCCLLACCNKK